LNKGFDINLTIDYAWNLLVKQEFKCSLSGKDIKLMRNMKIDYEQQTASLDRIDSTKGYIEGNVWWVHKDVNLMKNILSEEYFVEICCQVADKKRGELCSPLVSQPLACSSDVHE